jgi:hypothetical protein
MEAEHFHLYGGKMPPKFQHHKTGYNIKVKVRSKPWCHKRAIRIVISAMQMGGNGGRLRKLQMVLCY